jgi:26S proteasome regulatory subunit T5
LKIKENLNPTSLSDSETPPQSHDKQGKAMVIKTTTRQTVFLPVIGLVEAEDLKPGDLVGVNKDS